jgi:hypothetical protein
VLVVPDELEQPVTASAAAPARPVMPSSLFRRLVLFMAAA